MQEKDMKQKLDQELSEVAPDILQKILAEPRVPIKSEEELYGEQGPLFKEKMKFHPYVWASAVAAVLAVVVLIVSFLQISNNFGGGSAHKMKQQVAYSIFIDVNPSICIDVNEDGNVVRIKNINKDAKKIVASVNRKISDNTSYDKALTQIIHQLKQKYFKKSNHAMLVSVASKNEKNIQGKTKEVKKVTDKIKKEQKVSCKTLYQKCVITKKVQKVAEKNKISVGKAALCIKLAEKKKSKVENLCKEEISSLVQEAEDSGTLDSDDYEEGEIFPEDLEGEETTMEMESGMLDETTEENTGETVSEDFGETVEESELITDSPETTIPETAPQNPVNRSNF